MTARSVKRRNDILFILCSILFSNVIMIQGCKQNSAENMITVISRAENEAWNNGNVDLLDDIYDPYCILHVGSTMDLEGTEGFKQMIRMFHNEIPDCQFTINEIFSSGDKITERYTWQGTHQKTGIEVSVAGCVVMHLRDGEIVEAWNYEDLFGFYQQLGLVSTEFLMEQSEE